MNSGSAVMRTSLTVNSTRRLGKVGHAPIAADAAGTFACHCTAIACNRDVDVRDALATGTLGSGAGCTAAAEQQLAGGSQSHRAFVSTPLVNRFRSLRRFHG